MSLRDPNGIQSMMSGVIAVHHLNKDNLNEVTLEYTDHTLETAELTDAEIEAGQRNFFSLVSAVQSKREGDERATT